MLYKSFLILSTLVKSILGKYSQCPGLENLQKNKQAKTVVSQKGTKIINRMEYRT